MSGTANLCRISVSGFITLSCGIAEESGALLPDTSGSVAKPLLISLEEAQNRAPAAGPAFGS